LHYAFVAESGELFEEILENEEAHIDWLGIQLDLVARIGIRTYMRSQIGESPKS
jgi:bacterioferritin